MRIFALELDNDIKGIERRKAYIEGLIEKLPKPDIVVLPELAICSYMASQKIWKLADDCGRDASQWTVSIAKKTIPISEQAISTRRTATTITAI